MSMRFGDIIALMTGGAVEDISGSGSPTVSPLQTELDKKILPKVVEILNRFGKILDYNIYTSYSFDETTNESTFGGAEIKNVKSIPPFEVDIKYVNGDLVQIGDMLTGVAGKDIEFNPANGIEVVFDSQIWKVVRYQPVYSGEQVALYLFQLRQ